MENEENSTIGQEGDSTSWMDLPLGAGTRGDKKKRFNEDQIKSLETMFQNQTKLEPRQKLQLAKELNLEPRQVAIWFQNKRARWKSKKLEREYGVLKSEYDSLLSSFESLKKEKQMLLKKMEKLAELLEKKEPITTIKNDPFTPPLGVLSSEEDKSKSMYLSEEDQQDLYTWQRGDEDVQCSLQPSWPSVVDPLSTGSQHSHSQWWDFWPVKE